MVDIDSDRARSVGIDFHGFRSEPRIDGNLIRKKTKIDASALPQNMKKTLKFPAYFGKPWQNLYFSLFSSLWHLFWLTFHIFSTPRASFCLPWAPLGAIWGSLWASLEPFWHPLASLWRCLGAPWRQFWPLGTPRAPTGTIFQ